MAKKQIQRKPRKIITPKACAYCTEGKQPSFTDTKMLEKFITERGKIQSRVRTGLCAKHQRGLTLAVKHSRHLALMPFMAQV